MAISSAPRHVVPRHTAEHIFGPARSSSTPHASTCRAIALATAQGGPQPVARSVHGGRNECRAVCALRHARRRFCNPWRCAADRRSSQRRLILHVTHWLHARSTITLLTIVATKKTDPETVTCRVFVIGMHSGPVDQVALGLLLDVAPTNARLWRMLCATQCSMVGCTLRHAACCMLQDVGPHRAAA